MSERNSSLLNLRIRPVMRSTWIGQAMSTEAALALLDLARKRYGHDKARLAVLVRPVAVEKVVDNARDAAESIRRLRCAREYGR